MKKLIQILVMLISLCLFAGCNRHNTYQQSTLSLYYRQAQITYDQADNLIASEQIPWSDTYYDLESLLSVYLQGPKTETLTNVFPRNTVLTEISQEDGCLSITLSKEAANMDKLSLTVGGACLSKTIFPYTDTDTILIQAEGGFTALSEPLIFTRDNVLLQDEAAN